MKASAPVRVVVSAMLASALPLAASPAQAAPTPIAPVEWTRTVLTTAVVDPTDLDVAPDGTLVIAERTGTIKVWSQSGTLTTAGKISVSANASLTEVAEDALEEGGIHGLLLDRDFLRSRKIFLHYSVPGSVRGAKGEGVFRISSFVLSRAGKLDLRSEKKVLDVPAEWAHCCHYGGDMEWMKDGTILLTVGDDTSPRDEGWNPRDKRKGREAFNADRTAGNKLDRRGKVLRFRPDGGVPANNPFAGNKAYDPYVYAMGFRSNYRMGHDQVTGATFVGNVGPDATTANAARGPAGYDELEVVPPRGGTNHGWPSCIANNVPYMDYDYATSASKGPLSCKGMTAAALYYQGVPSTTFPLVGAGTRTSMAGPVYRGKGALALPASFQGKLIHWDWSRSIVFATPVKADGTLDVAGLTPWSTAVPNTFFSVGAAVPAGGPSAPIEMVVGPDGALYVAEYGSGYYQNTNSAISRISCFQCKPSATDYQARPATTNAPAATAAAAAVAAVRPEIATTRGLLAATGGPIVPLATLALVAMTAAVLLARRNRWGHDVSGL